MRRKREFVVQVQKRILEIDLASKRDTQSLRTRCIERLEPLFNIASSIATGETTDQQVEGKPSTVTTKERQMWAHVAAHVAEVIGNLSKGYDERQFNEDLARLERQIDEIKKLKAEQSGSGNSGTKEMQTTAEPSDRLINVRDSE